jgi:hypothetical protein
MIAIAQSVFANNGRISGFGLVTVFSLIGLVASLALVQQGIDLSSSMMA